ncbi:MAG: hypothetical protein U0736_14745 [Gemmataceae bacterium]
MGTARAADDPARGLPRLLAWLFYTGAAGGVTFTLLLLVATLGGSAAALIDHLATGGPMRPERTFAYNTLRGELYLTLYVVCYGLSADVRP